MVYNETEVNVYCYIRLIQKKAYFLFLINIITQTQIKYRTGRRLKLRGTLYSISKLMKGKAHRKHSLPGKTTAIVLLKLFIEIYPIFRSGVYGCGRSEDASPLSLW